MGFFRKLIYATLVSEKVRDAIKIDELKKLNEAMAREKVKKGKKK